jgi:hypothetical protein
MEKNLQGLLREAVVSLIKKLKNLSLRARRRRAWQSHIPKKEKLAKPILLKIEIATPDC